jgi:hypothetical protein
MQSKVFFVTKLLGLVAVVFLIFLPAAEGIRETFLPSGTHVHLTSTNLDSQPGERTMGFAEVISKNSYSASLRLPDHPSIMLFVGIGLVGLAVWAKRRAKRTTR